MHPTSQRQVGDELSTTEYQLLTTLCAGQDPRFVQAQAQLERAYWAGNQIADCACPLIGVTGKTSLTPIKFGGGPFATLEAIREGEGVGLVHLWVVDGFLHSVDYIPHDNDEIHDVLPDPGTYTFESIEV